MVPKPGIAWPTPDRTTRFATKSGPKKPPARGADDAIQSLIREQAVAEGDTPFAASSLDEIAPISAPLGCHGADPIGCLTHRAQLRTERFAQSAAWSISKLAALLESCADELRQAAALQADAAAAQLDRPHQHRRRPGADRAADRQPAFSVRAVPRPLDRSQAAKPRAGRKAQGAPSLGRQLPALRCRSYGPAVPIGRPWPGPYPPRGRPQSRLATFGAVSLASLAHPKSLSTPKIGLDFVGIKLKPHYRLTLSRGVISSCADRVRVQKVPLRNTVPFASWRFYFGS